MLLSHRYKFIYLKTIKTAGTSIEIYFESYCVAPEHRDGPRHEREAQVTADGIVGYRGPTSATQVWYNHMPAAMLRERVGDEVWSRYFKFCAIRNPYDKVVSHFWFVLPKEKRCEFRSADFSVIRASFSEWVSPKSLPLDQPVFMIDDEVAVDGFIRYEHLQTDMEHICNRLGVSWAPEQLGQYKSEFRDRKEHFSEYYDYRSEELVRKTYAWEVAHFPYRCKA
jgi:hypothetical protein